MNVFWVFSSRGTVQESLHVCCSEVSLSEPSRVTHSQHVPLRCWRPGGQAARARAEGFGGQSQGSRLLLATPGYSWMNVRGYYIVHYYCLNYYSFYYYCCCYYYYYYYYYSYNYYYYYYYYYYYIFFYFYYYYY